jgi:cytochrome c553
MSICLLLLVGICSAQANNTAVENYQTHCASCHGADRLGGLGMALLPGNLGRLKKDLAKQVISQGRTATQMAGFASQLTENEIDALVEHIYTPVTPAPEWPAERVINSHIDYQHADLSTRPVYEVADKLNMFIVVELGDHSASLVDGDSFEVIHRFKTRPALHGGPKFSSDGRYVYFASRDGFQNSIFTTSECSMKFAPASTPAILLFQLTAIPCW